MVPAPSRLGVGLTDWPRSTPEEVHKTMATKFVNPPGVLVFFFSSRTTGTNAGVRKSHLHQLSEPGAGKIH